MTEIAQQTDAAAPAGLLGGSREFIGDFLRFAGWRGVVAAIFVALGALLEGAGLILLVPILAVVTDAGASKNGLLARVFHLFDGLGAQTKMQRLTLLLCAFAGLMIARAIVIAVRDSRMAQLQIGFMDMQQAIVTQRLAAARWDIVAKLRHARVMHVMGADMLQIGGTVRLLFQIGIAVVLLLSQCILALVLSPLLSLFTYAMLLAIAVTMVPALRRARDLGAFAGLANLSMMNITGQFLGGLKLAVSQNLQDTFVSEFRTTLHSLSARQLEYARLQTTRHLILSTLFAFVGALAILLGFGVLGVAPAVLMTLLLILARINAPAMLIQQGAQQFVQSLPTYRKIKELSAELAAASVETVPQNDAPVALPDGPIVFRGVAFHHGDNPQAPTLHNMDVAIAPGSVVGIAGNSGAGKTTFADLLVGLLPPQDGEISIADVPLRGAAIVAWRNQTSYVSQDPFLFHDTIRRNLTWAKPGAREEELWDALRFVGAETLVRRMDHGLDTVVGERGALVSGGERQRLALARALLRSPRLLILDEATNAMDIASEGEIVERLKARTPRLTIVMIAHRTETLQLCERVLVLKDGRFGNASA